ncbi:GIY-YIG nuclease family protein [Candidatus Shapirobacteria bacterium]|nr:GIY-YIG nuclease family protein [Candidatus Shapirobacteria bacterium]
MNTYYVYVLKCSNGTFYKGLTDNLNRRLNQRGAGKCQTTKDQKPSLVYVQICDSRQEARQLEIYLKSGSGREIIDELLPKWRNW